MSLFRVDKNDLLGRYLVACRDIKEGELILKESPIVIGAPINAFLTCFQCCQQLNPKFYNTCDFCKIAVVCTPKCNNNLHTTEECYALEKLHLSPSDFINNPQIILPLRCLLLRNYAEINKWEKLMKLESHLSKRKNTSIWNAHKITIEQVMKNLNLLSEDDLKCNLLQQICGVLDVNSFEVRVPFQENKILRALYLNAAMMAHDCSANTHLSVDDDFQMTIYSKCFIPKDSLICFNYANGLEGSYERKKHLKEGKYFDCSCKRCLDSTELGTNLSSIICSKCKKGLVVSTEPSKDAYVFPWKCSECFHEFKGNLIKTTVQLCQNKLNDFQTSLNCSDIDEAENLLKKFKLTLGSQHYIILELKQLIISLMNENSENCVRIRRINYCNDLLHVFEILDPGISRLQGITKYELSRTQNNLVNEEYQQKMINLSEYLKKMEGVEILMKSSVRLLLFEPKKSPEGRLLRKALKDLQILREKIEDIKRIIKLKQ